MTLLLLLLLYAGSHNVQLGERVAVTNTETQKQKLQTTDWSPVSAEVDIDLTWFSRHDVSIKLGTGRHTRLNSAVLGGFRLASI